MIRYLPLFFLLLACGCASKKEIKKNTDNLMAEVLLKRDALASSIATDSSGFVSYGDGLTFQGFGAAYAKRSLGDVIFSARDDDGKWHRHPKRDCYQTGSSKSEISRDGILGVLHFCFATGNMDCVRKIKSYGEAHDWVFGEGPKDLTWIWPLSFLVDNILGTHELDGSDDALPEYFAGFRGHLLAMYIWLNGKVKGGISPVESTTLNKLASENPGNPMIKCVWNLYNSESQSDVIDILLNDFPENPDDVYGWGSAPKGVYFGIVTSCLEGK
jgi:hypothetical protein